MAYVEKRLRVLGDTLKNTVAARACGVPATKSTIAYVAALVAKSARKQHLYSAISASCSRKQWVESGMKDFQTIACESEWMPQVDFGADDVSCAEKLATGDDIGFLKAFAGRPQGLGWLSMLVHLAQWRRESAREVAHPDFARDELAMGSLCGTEFSQPRAILREALDLVRSSLAAIPHEHNLSERALGAILERVDTLALEDMAVLGQKAARVVACMRLMDQMRRCSAGTAERRALANMQAIHDTGFDFDSLEKMMEELPAKITARVPTGPVFLEPEIAALVKDCLSMVRGIKPDDCANAATKPEAQTTFTDTWAELVEDVDTSWPVEANRLQSISRAMRVKLLVKALAASARFVDYQGTVAGLGKFVVDREMVSFARQGVAYAYTRPELLDAMKTASAALNILLFSHLSPSSASPLVTYRLMHRVGDFKLSGATETALALKTATSALEHSLKTGSSPDFGKQLPKQLVKAYQDVADESLVAAYGLSRSIQALGTDSFDFHQVAVLAAAKSQRQLPGNLDKSIEHFNSYALTHLRALSASLARPRFEKIARRDGRDDDRLPFIRAGHLTHLTAEKFRDYSYAGILPWDWTAFEFLDKSALSDCDKVPHTAREAESMAGMNAREVLLGNEESLREKLENRVRTARIARTGGWRDPKKFTVQLQGEKPGVSRKVIKPEVKMARIFTTEQLTSKKLHSLCAGNYKATWQSFKGNAVIESESEINDMLRDMCEDWKEAIHVTIDRVDYGETIRPDFECWVGDFESELYGTSAPLLSRLLAFNVEHYMSDAGFFARMKNSGTLRTVNGVPDGRQPQGLRNPSWTSANLVLADSMAKLAKQLGMGTVRVKSVAMGDNNWVRLVGASDDKGLLKNLVAYTRKADNEAGFWTKSEETDLCTQSTRFMGKFYSGAGLVETPGKGIARLHPVWTVTHATPARRIAAVTCRVAGAASSDGCRVEAWIVGVVHLLPSVPTVRGALRRGKMPKTRHHDGVRRVDTGRRRRHGESRGIILWMLDQLEAGTQHVERRGLHLRVPPIPARHGSGPQCRTIHRSGTR